MTDSRPAVRSFVALTLAISYAGGLLWWVTGPGHSDSSFMLFLAGYMFIPMTVALVLQKIVYKRLLALLGVRWRMNRWFVVGWLCPVFLSLASLGISCLVPGVRFSPDRAIVEGQEQSTQGTVARAADNPRMPSADEMRGLPPWAFIAVALAAGLVAGVTINAVAAFGEELGWRGFLPHYLRDMGFWRLSYLVGFIWGLWHVPVILQGVNYPQHPVTGSLLMIAQMMLLSPLLMYVRMRARSVMAAAVMHGTINGTFGVSSLFLTGGNDLTTGAMGLPGLAVLAAVNVLMFVTRAGKRVAMESDAAVSGTPC